MGTCLPLIAVRDSCINTFKYLAEVPALNKLQSLLEHDMKECNK